MFLRNIIATFAYFCFLGPAHMVCNLRKKGFDQSFKLEKTNLKAIKNLWNGTYDK